MYLLLLNRFQLTITHMSKWPILGWHTLLPFVGTWTFPESPVLCFCDSVISSDPEAAWLFLRRLIYNCTFKFKWNVNCSKLCILRDINVLYDLVVQLL